MNQTPMPQPDQTTHRLQQATPTNQQPGRQEPAAGSTIAKANLISFKAYFHQQKPLIVLLSETYWKKSFSVKFKQYNTVCKNRESSPGGGVAILIPESSVHPLVLPALQTMEAVAVTIALEINKKK